MLKIINRILVILLFLACNRTFAQESNPKYDLKRFPADSVKTLINEWTNELSIKHPGFYRYTTKEEFKAYIDSIKSTIVDSLSELQSFLKIKPIVSKIHCLHTGINLSKEYSDYLNSLSNLFPFQIYAYNGKAFIAKNFSASRSVVEGDEIISINGQSIKKIISQLFELIPADGYNETMKYRALYYQFPSWYRLIDPTDNFTLKLKRSDREATCQVKGAKYNDIARDGFLREPKREKQLDFKVQNKIAFLTIHTFSNSEIKRGGQNFQTFIDDAFSVLRKENLGNLVVDLRDNTGGSDANAVYFVKQFFDKPFRYWDRIEVTEAIAKQIKGLSLKLFYRKPQQRDSVWLWQKARHLRDFDFYEEQSPARNPFTGKTFILINGFCMSSCADAAAILSHNKKALFIGQETGGGYQGNNSGMMPATKMPPFDFTITIPLQKYFNYVDSRKNFGRGTPPDYPVNQIVDDILEEKDAEMETAVALIKDTLS